MNIEKLPRIHFANLPTPLEEMPRLAETLGGPRIFIKRDDQIGLAIGGNKVRKLEFIMADVIAKKAHTIITFGGIQSNFTRQTAAAANRFGIKTALILFGTEPEEYDGNVLLESLMGAELHFVDMGESAAASMDVGQAETLMEELAGQMIGKGEGYYVIPMGGHCTLGIVGYAAAAQELLTQAREAGIEIDYIVHATGSGTTQAGLALGCKALGARTQVIGIDIANLWKDFARSIGQYAEKAAELLDLDLTFGEEDIQVYNDYVGEGYAQPTEEAIAAIRLVAEQEGILLDPVYTSKAMAGLIDLTQKGTFDKGSTVAFIHTGGTPALYPFRRVLKR